MLSNTCTGHIYENWLPKEIKEDRSPLTSLHMLLPVKKLSIIIKHYSIHYYYWTVCPALCLYWLPVQSHRNIQRWSSSYECISVCIPVVFYLLPCINSFRWMTLNLQFKLILFKNPGKGQGTETNSLKLLQMYFTCVIKNWCHSETAHSECLSH